MTILVQPAPADRVTAALLAESVASLCATADGLATLGSALLQTDGNTPASRRVLDAAAAVRRVADRLRKHGETT